MANVAKYTRPATGQLCQHYERKKGDDGKYIKFGNQDINLSKTAQNYNLAPKREGGQINFIRQRTSEVKCLNRADVNVMCSWVVTLPKNFPSSQESEFFAQTYRFLVKRYGEKNVISAYVHRDENQPHIHFAFVPVTRGKDGKEKVSAKEVLTKSELQAFHPALQYTLEQSLGFEVAILNGATEGGNRTIQELKAKRKKESAEKIYDKYERQIDEMTYDILYTQEQVEKVHNELESIQGQKKTVQDEIDGLQCRLLTAQEAESLHGKKTITGCLKGVGYVEYEALKRTAVHVESIAEERDKAEEKATIAEKRAAIAEWKVKELMDERPALKMQVENVNLRARLERMERRLRGFMERVPVPIQLIIQKILSDREPFPKESERKFLRTR